MDTILLAFLFRQKINDRCIEGVRVLLVDQMSSILEDHQLGTLNALLHEAPKVFAGKMAVCAKDEQGGYFIIFFLFIDCISRFKETVS